MSGLAAVINPTAGLGRAAHLWGELCRAEPALSGALAVTASDAESSRRGIEKALATGIERLLVVGGDGTAQLAANVLLATGHAERVALGLVPAGTGCDLARAIGLPRRPGAALARVLAGRPRAIDVLELTTDDGRRRFVVNVASAGISGVVDESLARLARKGRNGYLRATLGALATFRPAPCHVTVDGEPWHEGPLLLLAVANSPTFGNGMRVAPGARLDDGEADLVLIGEVPRWQLPLRLPGIYLGTHVRSSHCRTRRCRAVRLEPSPGFPPFDLDGELFPAAPATIRLLPRALRLLA